MRRSRQNFRYATRLAALLSLAALAAASSGTGHAQGAISCSRYASPTGSDSSTGTATAPFSTAQRLVGALSAGQTGCLLGGVYSGNISFNASGAAGSPVTLTTAPGSTQATIRGVVSVSATASYITLDNLKVDATNASQLVAVQLFGDYGRLTRSDVSGGNQTGRIGVQVGYSKPVKGVEIDGNRIHNFGSAGRIYDQGIYIDLADGTLVHDNYIYDNAGGYGDPALDVVAARPHLQQHDRRQRRRQHHHRRPDRRLDRPSSYNEIDHNILSNPVSGNNTAVFWGSYSSSTANAGTATPFVTTSPGRDGSIQAPPMARMPASLTRVARSVDPQYVDRAAKNFALRAASLAAGFGANVAIPVAPPVVAPPVVAPPTNQRRPRSLGLPRSDRRLPRRRALGLDNRLLWLLMAAMRRCRIRAAWRSRVPQPPRTPLQQRMPASPSAPR